VCRPPRDSEVSLEFVAVFVEHTGQLEQSGVARGVVGNPDAPRVVMAVKQDEVVVVGVGVAALDACLDDRTRHPVRGYVGLEGHLVGLLGVGVRLNSSPSGRVTLAMGTSGIRSFSS